MAIDGNGEHVAIEIKRNGGIDGVEQLTRYCDLLNRDPLLAPVHGIFAAQTITPQARVLAQDRGFKCLLLDYEEMKALRTILYGCSDSFGSNSGNRGNGALSSLFLGRRTFVRLPSVRLDTARVAAISPRTCMHMKIASRGGGYFVFGGTYQSVRWISRRRECRPRRPAWNSPESSPDPCFRSRGSAAPPAAPGNRPCGLPDPASSP